MASSGHEPNRADVSVKTDASKGMPLTSVQGGKTGVSPQRAKVAGAHAPHRSPASIPVHQLRDTGSAGPASSGKPNMKGVD